MRVIQTFLIGILAGFLCGLMTCKSCTKPCSETKTDSVVVKDTTIIIVPEQRADIPQPTLANETRPRIDSFIQFLDLPADTSAIIRPYVTKYNALADKYNKMFLDHNTARTYQDTMRFDNGNVALTSDIFQNKQQKVSASLFGLQQTTITNTVTKYERRVIGFFGLSGGYQFADSSAYIGSSFRLKFKSDMLLGLAAKYSSRSRLMVEAEYAVPIRLGRRK